MIQRIQTLFLFIAIVLLSILICIPFAEIMLGNGEIYLYKVYGIYLSGEGNELITATYPLSFLVIITSIIIIISIFLFKKRLLQLRLCFISIILLAGMYGLGFFYIYKLSSEYETTIHYTFPIIIPLISAILAYLAMRAIKKDEILVSSLDRIR